MTGSGAIAGVQGMVARVIDGETLLHRRVRREALATLTVVIAVGVYRLWLR